MAILDKPSRRLRLALEAINAAPAQTVTLPARPTPAILAAMALTLNVDFDSAERAYDAVLTAADADGY